MDEQIPTPEPASPARWLVFFNERTETNTRQRNHRPAVYFNRRTFIRAGIVAASALATRPRSIGG